MITRAFHPTLNLAVSLALALLLSCRPATNVTMVAHPIGVVVVQNDLPFELVVFNNQMQAYPVAAGHSVQFEQQDNAYFIIRSGSTTLTVNQQPRLLPPRHAMVMVRVVADPLQGLQVLPL